jgi:UDP-N-acetylmuramoyl-tripeptide--D-alanyl-D-alanine ligase
LRRYKILRFKKMKKTLRKVVQFYLKILVKIIIWRKNPLIIAVAGSTNKTFVKEIILQELGKKPELIRGNPESFNTEIGLPLAVLFLPSGYSSLFKWAGILLKGTYISLFSRAFPQILILEMGVDRKGDMAYLLSMVKPKIAVVTDVSKNFPSLGTSLEDIAREISLLLKKLPSSGLAVLNGDDARVAGMKEKTKAEVILYGQSEKCDVRADNVTTTKTGQTFDLVRKSGTEKIEIEKFGQHNVHSLMAGKIVAEEIRKREESFLR